MTKPTATSAESGLKPGRIEGRCAGRCVWLAVAVVCGLIFSGYFMWRTVVQADQGMREDLLQQARLIAKVVDITGLDQLSATAEDLEKPDYRRLKTELSGLRATSPAYRFIYLMGRRPDGQIYFVVDSEAPGAKDYSPPGEIYEDASDDLLRAFSTGAEIVEGPVADRWGVWVSALVPLKPDSPGAAESAGAANVVLGIDVDARMWHWALASNSARPVGLMLILMIGAAVLLIVSRRQNVRARPVLHRLLPPLAAIVVLIMFGAGWILWQQHQSQMSERIGSRVADVSRNLRLALTQQATGLIAAAQPVATDPAVRSALSGNRAEHLLSSWTPLFEAMRGQSKVTHFDFYGADRRSLLRVDKPAERDVHHESALLGEAERTGRAVFGLTLEPSGVLSLQVVQPVVEDGRIAGYVELGKDIEDILQTLAVQPGLQVAVLIHKRHIEQAGWASEGRRSLDGTTSWNQIPHSVAIFASQGQLPDAFIPFADHDPDEGHASFEREQEVQFDNKTWRVATTPVQDANGSEIGDLMVMEDVSSENRDFARLMTTGISASGVLLAMLLGIIVVLLRRTDAGIVAQQNELQGELRFRAKLMDAVPSPIFYKDAQGAYIGCNKAFEQYIGFPASALIGKTAYDIAPPDLAEAYHRADRRLLDNPGKQTYEAAVVFADGARHEVVFHKATFADTDGTVAGLIGVILDITERKMAEKQLQLAASVFTHAREGILITDANGTIVDVNATFTRITGYSRADVLGRNPRILSSGRHDTEFYAAMWRALEQNGYWSGEICNRRKDGEIYVELKTISAVRDEKGKTLHYVALFSDITAIKEHEKQLKHIAHFDALTTLPNRVLLADRLDQAMAQANRHKQQLAVAYLDLDGFKAVNDKHGHEIGDQFLVQISSQMRTILRDGDTLARIGGDEFVAVLLDLADVGASESLLQRLLVASARAVRVGELVLQCSASIGVAFFPQEEEVDADQLLRQADQAMYQAKLAGKNRVHIFDAEQDRSLRGLHESLERIRLALGNDEFVLHFQPKVNMASGEVIGAEALIRWQHPERGLLPPAVFLPVVEDQPVGVQIGEWVVNAAMEQMQRWQAEGLRLPVSVNIGARQLQDPGFVDSLQRVLARHPAVAAGDLSLEILETSALEDLARVSTVIESCHQMGVNCALDDFGTGYSSLTYLKRLPVSQLKIDQSFVRNMLDDADDLAILAGVLSLAGAFRREVVAEGVETIEHGALLLQMGCVLAQGYGIARPMPGADIPGWTRTWRPPAVWQSLPPVGPAERPLLFAAVEHRAWLRALGRSINGDSETFVWPRVRACRFGQWLESEDAALSLSSDSVQRLKASHQQWHDLAEALEVGARASGHSEAVAILGKLHALDEQFGAQLQRQMQH